MAVGEFDKVVAFQKNTATTLGAGKADSYATYCTTRGRLRKQNGSRGLSFGEMLQSSSFELLVRYESLLASNLRNDNKVLIDSKLYSISSYELIEEKKRYYKLTINLQE